MRFESSQIRYRSCLATDFVIQSGGKTTIQRLNRGEYITAIRK